MTTPIRSLIFQQQSLTISFGMQSLNILQNEKRKNIQMNLNAHITKNVSWDGWNIVYKKEFEGFFAFCFTFIALSERKIAISSPL